ncbi:MAG: hypothetical protein GTN69_08530 [Armatimonadetes bacterium]|nr:hypothetical protein [Gemmatimonadales bacterium]NIO75909.1 hypothetical protein [Armatimonadota bacterium]
MTRLKNLAREAESLLEEHGIAAKERGDFLKPVQGLLDEPTLWQNQANGMALFAAPGFFKYYQLPVPVEESAIVQSRFHLIPLLSVIADDGRYFVLALGLGGTRLFQGTQYEIAEIPVEQMPKDLADALRFDEPEKQLQSHTVPSGAGAGGDRHTAVFHGHGVGTDDRKTNILRYFRQIDKALQGIVRDEAVPLVLAGIEYLHPIYREANSYRNLTDEGVKTNPDDLSEDELRGRAWEIVAPLVRQAQTQAIEDFGQLKAGERASTNLADVIRAATDGRVATLFVEKGAQRWGTFGSAKRQMRVHDSPQPGDEELLNLAAVRAFTSGARVFVIDDNDMPTDGPIAAIFRW